ncbi:hypothetical protein KY46_05980 [Photobacterium halotolerans]|uniref:Uncharacterized protein n=1 Tax=Photobacterium halotolerans TaxID=265726 RepID=A0A0F5VER6_9GAMM|nr:hypothetical protein KY46_05980 [Photobacterium halotolerans]
MPLAGCSQQRAPDSVNGGSQAKAMANFSVQRNNGAGKCAKAQKTQEAQRIKKEAQASFYVLTG